MSQRRDSLIEMLKMRDLLNNWIRNERKKEGEKKSVKVVNAYVTFLHLALRFKCHGREREREKKRTMTSLTQRKRTKIRNDKRHIYKVVDLALY